MKITLKTLSINISFKSCTLNLKRGSSDRKSSTKDKTNPSIFQVENVLASSLQGSLGRFRHTAGPHEEFLAQASKGRQRSVSIPPRRADSDRSIAKNPTVSSKLHSSSQKTLRVALPPSSFNWNIEVERSVSKILAEN